MAVTKERLSDDEVDDIINTEAKSKGMDYEWSYAEEPHASRRREILKDHPEIKKLFGHHPRSKYYAFATVALQAFMAWYCSDASRASWWTFLFLAYFVGGTCNHSLTLAIHEMSHHLFFKSPLHNRLYSLFCNFPLVVPYSVSFKKYHLEHHKFQGVDGIDTDIPTAIEGRFFTTPFRKALWVLFQPFFYAIRPLVVNPKPLNQWDVLNLVTQATYMALQYKFGGGINALFYLFVSTFLGLGCHFCAGHFIAEHYTTLSSKGEGAHRSGWTPISSKAGDKSLQVDETFTYRGPLNMFSYNVGVHVAHHDFPFVSGLRLFELEKMAPEYYDHLPETKSWPGATLSYIFSDANPFDRVKRHSSTGAKAKQGSKPALTDKDDINKDE
jgi:sphingolipid delta-4 desaturase